MDKYGFLHIGKTGGTAANAVLRANNKRRAGEFVRCYTHKTTLEDVRDDNLCERVLFFVREPVTRYISAFNSRLRKGYPRHQGHWTPSEEVAFAQFGTPNQLAEALSADDPEMRQRALDAMNGIRHLKRAYKQYLGSVELLEAEKDRIYFIGTTESFDADFGLLRRLLNVAPDIELPTDDYGAHRTPPGFERTVSELGRQNVRDYYKADYEIYDWCIQRREELLAIRREEAANQAAAE